MNETVDEANKSIKKSRKITNETDNTDIAVEEEKPKIESDGFNNAIELIRAHLKCIEKLQHVIVRNLFNDKTTTNSSMAIKLECADDQNYLTMETTFLTRTRIPNEEDLK